MRHIRLALCALAVVFSVNTASAATDDAKKFVNALGAQALTIISNVKATKPQKQAQLEKLFSDNVDIGWISKFVLGRHLRTATDAQKTKYMKEYRSFILAHYVSRFTDYTGGKFKVTDGREDSDGEFTISMEIAGDKPGANPVLLDYRVRKDAGGFKVFDVIVEGVSLITTQRSEFNSVVTNKGLDFLIDALAKKSIGMPEPAKSAN